MKFKSLVLIAAIFCDQSHAQNDKLIEYPPQIGVIDANAMFAIPVIICGRAVSSSALVGPIKVKVENVVQGDLTVGDTIDIYTFEYADNEGGTGRLPHIDTGDRNIYLLLHDAGTIRLVCDGCASAAPKVYSGAHPDLKRDERLPPAEQITEILLTRGVSGTEDGMLDAINWVDGGRLGWKVVLAQLQKTAMHETPRVREKACKVLKDWDLPCPRNDDFIKSGPKE